MSAVETNEQKITIQIRQIESVLGYVKTHVSSGALNKAKKEAEALEKEIWKLREVLNHD